MNMPDFDYDLFVIGAGSGGVRAARIAASYGAKVAIAEEDRVGGTCVIRGCVPKKLLVYASRFADDFADAAGYGWQVVAPRFDWPTLIANKDKEIARLEAAYERNLASAGVTLHRKRAVLTAPHAVQLLPEKSSITARHILIATGAKPFIDPKIPGSELAITSNDAFHLPKLPRTIVIGGGGYIALEFAGIFHGLGSEVTVVYRGEEILRGFDDDLRKGLHTAYEARGIRIRCGTTVSRIENTGEGVSLALSDGSKLAADQMMMATGRKPNTAGLGLEDIAVALDHNGAVIVDEYSMSTLTGIHAIGDVTNRLNLTPVAIRDGQAFADTVFGGKPTPADHVNVPKAVFSTPELATVGLTEAQAREQFPAIDIYKTTFRPMRNTLAGRDEAMLMKIAVDQASDRVLGVHILGPDASEIVQVCAIAIKMGATKAQFDAAAALHPTAAEELVTTRKKWIGA
jgi:glutathione reductase (NADPH)